MIKQNYHQDDYFKLHSITSPLTNDYAGTLTINDVTLTQTEFINAAHLMNTFNTTFSGMANISSVEVYDQVTRMQTHRFIITSLNSVVLSVSATGACRHIYGIPQDIIILADRATTLDANSGHIQYVVVKNDFLHDSNYPTDETFGNDVLEVLTRSNNFQFISPSYETHHQLSRGSIFTLTFTDQDGDEIDIFPFFVKCEFFNKNYFSERPEQLHTKRLSFIKLSTGRKTFRVHANDEFKNMIIERVAGVFRSKYFVTPDNDEFYDINTQTTLHVSSVYPEMAFRYVTTTFITLFQQTYTSIRCKPDSCVYYFDDTQAILKLENDVGNDNDFQIYNLYMNDVQMMTLIQRDVVMKHQQSFVWQDYHDSFQQLKFSLRQISGGDFVEDVNDSVITPEIILRVYMK